MKIVDLPINTEAPNAEAKIKALKRAITAVEDGTAEALIVATISQTDAIGFYFSTGSKTLASLGVLARIKHMMLGGK